VGGYKWTKEGIALGVGGAVGVHRIVELSWRAIGKGRREIAEGGAADGKLRFQVRPGCFSRKR
jgi:hypothetical protein